MPEKRNYLLGYGERLTAPVEISGGGGEKKPPYSFEEARARLVPMLQGAAAALDALPQKACPNGQAVASLTLHPEYYAKSHYPAGLLREAGLRTVGSKAKTIVPEQRSRGREPKQTVTTELFVAGPRDSFHRLADQMPSWEADASAAKQLTAIETVSAIEAEERMRPLKKGKGKLPLEIVLHASESSRDRFILAGFKAYLEELGLEPDLERIFFAGQLCFLRLRARCPSCARPTRCCAAPSLGHAPSSCRSRTSSTRAFGSLSLMAACRRRARSRRGRTPWTRREWGSRTPSSSGTARRSRLPCCLVLCTGRARSGRCAASIIIASSTRTPRRTRSSCTRSSSA
jgi:hypothetical protein